MSAKLIDGKMIAAGLRVRMTEAVDALRKQAITPGLGVVLVGDDPASHSYVSAKAKACAETGMRSVDRRLPATVSEAELLDCIEAFNADPRIHGILVQLPLPGHLPESTVIRAIRPEKDVDGFHPVTLGRMLLGEDTFLPCTPHGILQLLCRCGIETAGRHAVVVGRSNIVGRPLACLLAQKRAGGNATVTVCHTGTPDIGHFTRQADILIVAAGRPGVITGEMIKTGAAVIDVGVNRVDAPDRPRGYRLVGDVDFDSARVQAGWITPVPGGVGPMTITMLLYNTLCAASLAAGHPAPDL